MHTTDPRIAICRTLRTGVVILLLAASGRPVSARDLHANVGAGMLTIVPTVFAELEYGEPGNAIRLNYSLTTPGMNFLGDKEYQALFLEYTLSGSEDRTSGDSHYLRLGLSKTTGGSSGEYDYAALGYGVEHVFRDPGILSHLGKHWFFRYFVDLYWVQSAPSTPAVPFEVNGGILLGTRLF
jgi:hypothetical protein